MDIAAKVKEIVSDKLDVDGADIQEEQDFIEDLKADSLAVVEVVLALEEQFEIEIPDMRSNTSRRSRAKSPARVPCQAG
jgi:acyl carrier protein